MSFKRAFGHVAAAAALALGAASASAAVVFDTWTSNADANTPQANIKVTVTKNGSNFDWILTVNPWNAEALGLFVDFGNVTMPSLVSITNVVTTPTSGGTVALFAKDTTSDDCGSGCNLNGSPPEPVLNPDNQWELVFRLGTSGYEGIQTWNWRTEDFGLDESAFKLMAYRTQVNCPAGSTLPGSTNCTGSQKGYGFPTDNGGGPANGNGNGGGPANGGGNGVPEPATLGLIGLGMLAIGALRRRRSDASC